MPLPKAVVRTYEQGPFAKKLSEAVRNAPVATKEVPECVIFDCEDNDPAAVIRIAGRYVADQGFAIRGQVVESTNQVYLWKYAASAAQIASRAKRKEKAVAAPAVANDNVQVVTA